MAVERLKVAKVGHGQRKINPLAPEKKSFIFNMKAILTRYTVEFIKTRFWENRE